MKIAILGTDEDVVQLAGAARRDGHSLVWVGDVAPGDTAAVERIAPNVAMRSGEWELLLDRATADAVIVGRGAAEPSLRDEQLKRLVMEGVPILTSHPVVSSVLPYYEVDMIRREIGTVARHYNPAASHPVVAQLAGVVRDGHPTIGAIQQITLERRLSDPSRNAALRNLARDAELLAAVGGAIRRVTAIGPAMDAESFASLQIQFLLASAASARWSLAPSTASGPGLKLELVGERGSLVVRTHRVTNGEPGEQWQLSINDDGDDEPLDAFDAPAQAILDLSASIESPDAMDRTRQSTWGEATRAMEVVDAVELSLQKGKTIDVFQQQLTEQLAFRGWMAAFGCGLLLVAFAALVVVAVLGGAEFAMGQRIIPFWPFVLLAVLAFFLLLQAIPLLASKRRKSD